jgi:phage gp36-like protein
MARFLTDEDYSLQIKTEIRKLLDGSTPSSTNPYKLIIAEDTAISQIKKWISHRYDCTAIFSAIAGARDSFIIMIVIDLGLYHLYSQTGSKDLPSHRQERYQDALDWLKQAGKGEITSDLPSLITETNPGDVRIFSKPPENHTW